MIEIMNKCPNPKCQESNPAEAYFCHICGTKLQEGVSPYSHLSEIDKNILVIIRENSYSKRMLAAYDGRRYANNLAKKSFGKEKKNHKEYVEMLMRQNYPQELEKSILGKEYLVWFWLAVIFALTLFGLIFTIPIIIWILLPLHKKLKSMCA